MWHIDSYGNAVDEFGNRIYYENINDAGHFGIFYYSAAIGKAKMFDVEFSLRRAVEYIWWFIEHDDKVRHDLWKEYENQHCRKCFVMSFDKHMGKERRKPYRGAKAIDKTCRNHGSDPFCRKNRTHFDTKRRQVADANLKEVIS